MIRIVVDGAPVAKGRGRVGRVNGRIMVFTPAHTRKYEDVIRYAAGQAMNGAAPLDEPLNVEIYAELPVPASWSQKRQREALAGFRWPTGRPDVDNYIKAALDGCNTIVWRDDSCIVEITARKRYSMRPRLEIEVRTVNAQTNP